jgi:hypothetical protein
MASPMPVGSQLRCRKARNGAVIRRVIERRGCAVVIAITFICAGRPVDIRPGPGGRPLGSGTETDRATRD